MCSYLDISFFWKSIVLKGVYLFVEVWEKYRKWIGVENIFERFKKRGYRWMFREFLNEDVY